MPLKLVSTEASDEMTVQSRKPKPIQPSVPTLNWSMREKSWFEISRAWCANSDAAMRFFSFAASSSAARNGMSSSCPFSISTISSSIFALICVRA